MTIGSEPASCSNGPVSPPGAVPVIAVISLAALWAAGLLEVVGLRVGLAGASVVVLLEGGPVAEGVEAPVLGEGEQGHAVLRGVQVAAVELGESVQIVVAVEVRGVGVDLVVGVEAVGSAGRRRGGGRRPDPPRKPRNPRNPPEVALTRGCPLPGAGS